MIEIFLVVVPSPQKSLSKVDFKPTSSFAGYILFKYGKSDDFYTGFVTGELNLELSKESLYNLAFFQSLSWLKGNREKYKITDKDIKIYSPSRYMKNMFGDISLPYGNGMVFKTLRNFMGDVDDDDKKEVIIDYGNSILGKFIRDDLKTRNEFLTLGLDSERVNMLNNLLTFFYSEGYTFSYEKLEHPKEILCCNAVNVLDKYIRLFLNSKSRPEPKLVM